MPTARLTDRDLLAELEPVADHQLRRHEQVADEWFPHEYVPYSQGRDFDTEPWTPDHSRLTGVAQIAFEVNLLTEDNLPSYHREIFEMFGTGDGAWINWTHRWTAEEGRHSIVLRDYLTVTRAIDPVELERGRMQQMMTGYDRGGKDALRGMAYVSFQELATRISHRNTGRYSDDPIADRIMARISKDENLHMIFYRDMVTAAMHLDPSRAIEAIAAEVAAFEMPGTGMRDFNRKAVQIAQAGIYDLRVHHDDVVWPLLRHWGVFDVEGLDEQAEQAREQLAGFLTGLDQMATRFDEKRAARAARLAARVS
ncbi:acyl-ACP desaturase [Nitriliruptor alkaliphilus]|uniref:acyl-ACP desaturase n=1 Tax=Nitriliruptor alkaliphilus TaxID=427918 RepID=UPI000698CE57|nr:acyl-ACP desaturase [Nitriliruptor alkaliphilus]